MSAKGRIRIWTAPIVLGVLTAVGLVAALLSDSVGDVLAWVTLAAPVAVVLWYAPRRRRNGI
jgi:4-hydroxybenzoate polyprenyltransferase